MPPTSSMALPSPRQQALPQMLYATCNGHVTGHNSKDGTQDLRHLLNRPRRRGEAFAALRSGSGKPLLYKGECLTTLLQMAPQFQDALQSMLDARPQASGCPRKPSRASRHQHWARERKGSVGQVVCGILQGSLDQVWGVATHQDAISFL